MRDGGAKHEPAGQACGLNRKFVCIRVQMDSRLRGNDKNPANVLAGLTTKNDRSITVAALITPCAVAWALNPAIQDGRAADEISK